MTTRDLQSLIGQERTYSVGTLDFRVTILDTRMNYGRLECKITPISGSGERWVVESNLREIVKVSEQ